MFVMWQQLLYVERLFWFTSVNVRLAFMRISLLDAHHDMSQCALRCCTGFMRILIVLSLDGSVEHET